MKIRQILGALSEKTGVYMLVNEDFRGRSDNEVVDFQRSHISFERKARYSIPLLGIFFVSYIVPNRVHFFEPYILPQLSIDKLFPVVPWTIYIYLSEWFLYLFVLAFVHDNATFRRLITSLIATFMISMCVFFLFPTALIRPDVIGEGLTSSLFRFLHSIDTPFNCFPSQHVAIVTIPPLVLWQKSRAVSFGFWIWAILIWFSTLTTKQHYFIDILGGLALAWFSVLFANYFEENNLKKKMPLLLQRLLP